jgi:glutamate 5-kinase
MKPSECKRLVVKVGSALLVDRATGRLKKQWLSALCDDLNGLKSNGTQVVVVSSGAIAFGRKKMGLGGRALNMDESQGAAAVGQPKLMMAWGSALKKHNIITGQVLLTRSDIEHDDRYVNARNTVAMLLTNQVIPIFNENDTIATEEITYGDNDRLAAHIAAMIGADGLILLSDIDGMYTANPQIDKSAQFLSVIDVITPEIEAMAGGAASEYSRGGMKTKVEAAKIAVNAGCEMLIANGRIQNPVRAIEQGGKCTVFKARRGLSV